MTTGMQFWDLGIWAFVLALTAISAAMLVANILIRTIRPLRRALVPSPVLGGFILLAVLSIIRAATGRDVISGPVLEMLTYHCLGLGFVATALKSKPKIDKKTKGTQKAIFNSGLVTALGYVLQAIVGVGISMLFFLMMRSWPASGLLVPMGYGQGPGQAYTWGNIYSQLTPEGSAFGAFEGGKSFGLTIAAMGYVSATIGGIFYLNSQRRKGNVKMTRRAEEREERYDLSSFTEKGEIPPASSIDKGSVQFGLILLSYALAFGIMYGISTLCDASGVAFLVNTVKPLAWGFNFIFATLMGGLVKLVLDRLGNKNIIRKKYTNNYLLDRFGGLFFDVMVVAAIAAIDLRAFGDKKFVAPLIVMCVAGGVATYVFVKHIGKKVFKGYSEEFFLAFYGMLTGTASTGVILLREIDPEFKTPACRNLIFQPIYAMIMGLPVVLSMGMAMKDWTSLLVWWGIYAVFFCLVYALLRRDDIIRTYRRKKGIPSPVEEEGFPDGIETTNAAWHETGYVTDDGDLS